MNSVVEVEINPFEALIETLGLKGDMQAVLQENDIQSVKDLYVAWLNTKLSKMDEDVDERGVQILREKEHIQELSQALEEQRLSPLEVSNLKARRAGCFYDQTNSSWFGQFERRYLREYYFGNEEVATEEGERCLNYSLRRIDMCLDRQYYK